jgi:hypothetical protein
MKQLNILKTISSLPQELLSYQALDEADVEVSVKLLMLEERRKLDAVCCRPNLGYKKLLTSRSRPQQQEQKFFLFFPSTHKYINECKLRSTNMFN